MDVPYARRVAAPSWANSRTVLGLFLFAVAFVAGQRVLLEARSTVTMWAAARDLGPSAVLDSDDLRLVDVKLPDDQAALYVDGAEALEGSTLARSVQAGELIPVGALSQEPAGMTGRSITIPVAPEHANGGNLRPGDRVDVYATFNQGDARAVTALVASGLEVIDVVTAGGLVAGDRSAVGVTVATTPQTAGKIAFASSTAEVDLVRVIGTTPPLDSQSITLDDFLP